MRGMAVAFAVVTFIGASVGAQDRGRERSRDVPPGHFPPNGLCRVWYEDRPAGHQPPPTDCREAERIASRNRYVRVIYGSDGASVNDRWDNREQDRDRDRGRAIPRRWPSESRLPSRLPYPDSRDRDEYPERRPRVGYPLPGFDNGYFDGLEKGREDARDGDSYDPVRHRWYRSGDRGYDERYASKEDYKNAYREGFRAGYDEGYRRPDADTERDRRSSRLPWPF